MMMYAKDYISEHQVPCVQIKPSLIKGGGDGLFARRNIGKGQYVTTYYGDKYTSLDVFDLYVNQKDLYDQIAPYLRGTPNNVIIKGDKDASNPNLQGVYVNDHGHLSDTSLKSLKAYTTTLKLCNLRVVDTLDYPVYQSTRFIKKGEELYVHYGIGYWLQQLRVSADQISDMNQVYDFKSLYR